MRKNKRSIALSFDEVVKILSSNDDFEPFIDTLHSNCVMCENYDHISCTDDENGHKWVGIMSSDYPAIKEEWNRFQLWYYEGEEQYMKEDYDSLKKFFKESCFEKIIMFNRLR